MLQDLLYSLGRGRDAVALIEAELVTESVLAEPHTSECIQETFVQVVCHPTTILDLTWKGTQSGVK